MARIITSKLQHFDPMARGGEQVVTRGGPKFAKTGLFGGDMDINELNSLNAAIKSGMGIAKDVWPTIKGVVDPPMKKIQEMMQQSDIEKARAAAAKVALKNKDLPGSGEEVFQESVTEEVYDPSSSIPMSSEGFADTRGPLPRKAGSAKGLRLDPGSQMLGAQNLTINPNLSAYEVTPKSVPVSMSRPNLVRIDPLNRPESYRMSGLPKPSLPPAQLPELSSPSAQLTEPEMLQQAAQAQMRARQRPVQRPMPTGGRVSGLQERTSAAPARAATPTAPTRRTQAPAPPQAATSPSSQMSNEQLLSDPTNRAFVRTVMSEMTQRGQEADIGYATDLLRLEISKRGTPPTKIVDESVREVLTMPAPQAAKAMDTMGLYALADQSTIADWPKIEPIARRVIQKQPRGFLDLIDMKGELKNVYDRLATKKKGTPGVDFDLKGISDRALEGAKALKARGRRGKGSKGSKKFSKKLLDTYLQNKNETRDVGGKAVNLTVSETNNKFAGLERKVEAGTASERDRSLYDAVLARRQNKNIGFKNLDVKSVDPKTASVIRSANLRSNAANAKNLVDGTTKELDNLRIKLAAIKIPAQPAKGTKPDERRRIKKKIFKLTKERTRLKDRIEKEEKTLRTQSAALAGANAALGKDDTVQVP